MAGSGKFGRELRFPLLLLMGLGSSLALAAVLVTVVFVANDALSPMTLFLPVSVAMIGNGLAMPNAQAMSKRDDCLFDNLPWQWNPANPQAKRDAFARFSGRGYPREGYLSPYHLMLDMMRRDACADIARVIIEDTSVLGGS